VRNNHARTHRPRTLRNCWSYSRCHRGHRCCRCLRCGRGWCSLGYNRHRRRHRCWRRSHWRCWNRRCRNWWRRSRHGERRPNRNCRYYKPGRCGRYHRCWFRNMHRRPRWHGRRYRRRRCRLGLNWMGRLHYGPYRRRNWRGRVLFADGIQNIARLRDMRKVDLGLDDVFSLRTACSGVLGRGMRWPTGAEMSPDLIRLVVLQRTGMCLLLGDPQFRKYVGDRLALDFQLSRQIVDSNLTHPPSFSPD